MAAFFPVFIFHLSSHLWCIQQTCLLFGHATVDLIWPPIHSYAALRIFVRFVVHWDLKGSISEFQSGSLTIGGLRVAVNAVRCGKRREGPKGSVLTDRVRRRREERGVDPNSVLSCFSFCSLKAILPPRKGSFAEDLSKGKWSLSQFRQWSPGKVHNTL